MGNNRWLLLWTVVFCMCCCGVIYAHGAITASVNDTEVVQDESEPVITDAAEDKKIAEDKKDDAIKIEVEKKVIDKKEDIKKEEPKKIEAKKEEPEKLNPALVEEKLETEKIIEETVVPKVFAPVPDIDEKTESSNQLQEESKQAASAPVDIDDKTFAEDKNVELDVSAKQDLPTTLDTTDVDAGGNWLLKRAFWEQGERVYEKIMAINSAIYEQQIKFVKARNEADDLSDSSFRKLGFEQGQLSGLFDSMLEDIKKQREQQVGLSEPVRQLLKSLNEKQQELEQLKLNLQSIEELDNTLDKSMLNLNNQVKSCRDYEKQAWDHFKVIGRELNDKKARLLFYEMQGYLRTVEKNKDYFAGQLWDHFSSTVALMKKKFDELATMLTLMRKHGVDFAKELERFIQASREKELGVLASEREKLQKEQAQLEQQVEKQKAEKAVCPNMWVQMQTITLNAWHYTIGLFAGFFEHAWTWLRSFFK